MKSAFPKIVSAFAAVCLFASIITLGGCSKYVSKYKAVAFVHTNTAKTASMSFSDFEGTMVFNLKCGSDGGKIKYTANLEEGDIKVYYDCDGVKTPLFGIGTGGETYSVGGQLKNGRVYLIVETDGKCRNGKLNFETV